jgi:hypothetical protein
MATLLITFLGLFILPYIELVGILNLWNGGTENYIFWLFSFIVFPSYFVKGAISIINKFRSKLSECQVSQVEIYLLPN